MATTGSLGYSINVGGSSIQTTVSRSDESGVISDIDNDKLNQGKAATITVRDDNDTCTVALPADHGIATADKVDVHWAVSGVRYVRRGMAATVTGNSAALDGGAGSNLPAQDAAVIVTKQASAAVAFDGDDMVMFVAYSDQPASLDFQDSSGASVGAVLLNAGEPYVWFSDQGVTRPITGNAVASVKVTPGTATATNVKIRVVYSSL